MISLRSHVSNKNRMSYLFISPLKAASDILPSERPFMFQNPIFGPGSMNTRLLKLRGVLQKLSK